MSKRKSTRCTPPLEEAKIYVKKQSDRNDLEKRMVSDVVGEYIKLLSIFV